MVELGIRLQEWAKVSEENKTSLTLASDPPVDWHLRKQTIIAWRDHAFPYCAVSEPFLHISETIFKAHRDRKIGDKPGQQNKGKHTLFQYSYEMLLTPLGEVVHLPAVRLLAWADVVGQGGRTRRWRGLEIHVDQLRGKDGRRTSIRRLMEGDPERPAAPLVWEPP